MKKRWKIFWIVCGVAVCLGIICCAGAFALGVTADAVAARFPAGEKIFDSNNDDDDFDFDDYDLGDNETYGHHRNGQDETNGTNSTVSGKQGIISGNTNLTYNADSIDVEVCNGEVEVRSAASGASEITVETENVKEELCLRSYMEENELKLESADGKIADYAGKIIIYIPQGQRLHEASFEVKKGTLYVENIAAAEFSVSVGAGTAKIDNYSADEADLSCGAGTLTVNGAAEREVDIECGTGELSCQAPGKQSDYNYEIECGAGTIKVGGSKYSGVGFEKEINNHAAKNMSIECGIGVVTVSFSGA